MIRSGIAALVIGPLVVEFMVRAIRFLHIEHRLRELVPYLQQFKQAVGDDRLRENLVRQAGLQMVGTGVALLVTLAFATLLICAIPLALGWPEAWWSPYLVASTVTSTAWWMLRKRFNV